jgi:hypothetical protein
MWVRLRSCRDRQHAAREQVAHRVPRRVQGAGGERDTRLRERRGGREPGGALERIEQARGLRANLQELHPVGGIPIDDEKGRRGRRLRRAMLRAEPMHRPAIGERPGERRDRERRHKRVRRRRGSGGRLFFADRERELDPLVVGELGQVRRLAGAGAFAGLQPLEELARQLQEVRRVRVVARIELAHQGPPLRVAQDAARDRKGAAQQVHQVVDEELAVHGHAPRLDALGRGRALRVAQVRGKCHLLRGEVHGQAPAAARNEGARCRARTAATSATSSVSGGKLKSRSSSVGTGPNRRYASSSSDHTSPQTAAPCVSTRRSGAST